MPVYTFDTNDDAVRGIIDDIPDDFDLSGLIETAHFVVTNVCQTTYIAYNPDTTFINSTLEMIERWLTAHLYSCDHSRLLIEQIGKARDMIEGKVNLGLQLTHHGQQLMGIDFLGTLSSFGQTRRKVKVTWLGRTRDERRKKPLCP